MAIKISSVIAGTMNWGIWGRRLSCGDMAKLIDNCIANNITTFDHADIYGGYTTEAEFGKAMEQSDVSREDIVLISKCGIVLPAELANGDTSVKRYDHSKKHIITSVERSLINLNTDYLDILLLHRPSPLMNPAEIAEAIDHLQASGKIREFGVSNFSISQMDLLAATIAVDYNQIRFSATHSDAMRDGTLDHMQRSGIVPMAWNPLGDIFRGETPQTERLKPLLGRLAEKYNVPREVVLLAWIMDHPAHIVPVIGTTDIARIRQLSKAGEIRLDNPDWFEIWQQSMGTEVP